MATPSWDELSSKTALAAALLSSGGLTSTPGTRQGDAAAGGAQAQSKRAAKKAAKKAEADARREAKKKAAAAAKGAGAAKKGRKKGGAGGAAAGDAPRRARPPLPAGLRPQSGRRNILITSALPYVNNVPHLGNIIGCVLSADVYARFCRRRGHNAIYICGTDEYGTATETKAQEEGLSPREICDKYHAVHRDVYKWFDIDFDYFGRTSTPNPAEDKDWPQTTIAQSIFKGLDDNGELEEQDVEQCYCTVCEKFLSDRFIEGTCPHCAYDDARGDQCDKCGKLLNATELKDPRCTRARTVPHPEGARIEVRTSRHMFLRLPSLTPRLEAFINKSSTAGKWSSNGLQQTQAWLRDGLKPRCLTRDLKWGTPVPKDGFRDKVFYVWFDAPIGYISITANYSPEHWREWWQAPTPISTEEEVAAAGGRPKVELVQFMGKDNVPFHTVIFPASLIGSGEPWTLLHHISTTEYLQYEDGKFSKSRGVGVFGDSAPLTGIPPEVWRYYLLSNRPEVSDTVFTWNDFADKNNNELLKNVGNFVNRAVSFTFNNFDGKVPARGELTEADQAFVEACNGVLRDYVEAMEGVHLKAGLRHAMDLGHKCNSYMQEQVPWKLFKTDPAACGRVLNVALHATRLLAALTEPFMPGFCDKVCHQLNCDTPPVGDAFELDALAAGHTLNQPTPIFRVISDDEVSEFRARFGGGATGGAGGAGGAPESASDAAKGKKKKKKGGKGGDGGGKGGKGGGKKGAAPTGPAFARLDFRVGKIVNAYPHPDAEKLFVEEIDVGEEKPRQILSGLRPYYSVEDLIGRHIVVICNLKPRKMQGLESFGMVLCANNEDRSKVEFISVPAGARPGDRLVAEGLDKEGTEPDEMVNPSKKKNPWTAVVPELRTRDSDGVALYKDHVLSIGGEACVAPTVKGGAIA